MRRRTAGFLGLYLALLGASHAARAGSPDVARPDPLERAGRGPGRTALQLPAMGDRGPLDGRGLTVVSALEFDRGRAGVGAERPEEPLPVLLLHGSPGSAGNFDALGPALASTGRAVHALDLPGFGRSQAVVPSYSIRAHAHAALAALDALAIPRAHVVTWSMGGGVGLHLDALAPGRVASLAQLAAIGVQEAEGSGDYHLEHLKYALLGALVRGAEELVPHFGRLEPPPGLTSFIRNFRDTDQRPLRGLMQRSRTPTLILHGRDDFLVPLWAAETSHALIGPSRLVVLDAGHFLPLAGGGLERCLTELVPFLARHDRPGTLEPRGRVDAAPPRTGPGAFALEPFTLQRALHARPLPWVALLALAALVALAPLGVPLAMGLACGGLQLDFGLAAIAALAGGALPRGGVARRGLRALRGVGLVAAGTLAGGALGFAGSQWLALAVGALTLARASRRRGGPGDGSRSGKRTSPGGPRPPE